MSLADNLRRRIALRRYPRRFAATFTDENDHNPRVLQDCPACSGSGQHCHHNIASNGHEYALGVCAACSGTGVTGALRSPRTSLIHRRATSSKVQRPGSNRPGASG